MRERLVYEERGFFTGSTNFLEESRKGNQCRARKKKGEGRKMAIGKFGKKC